MLLAILLLLFGVWTYKQYQKTQQEKQVLSGKQAFVYDPQQVNGIEITNQGQRISLQKANDRWMVALADKTFPADSLAVSQLLSGLKDVKIANIVTYSLDNVSSYGLDDPNKIQITLKNNDAAAADFIVGDFGQNSNTIYAVFANDAKIVLLEGYRNNLIPIDWRDKTIFRLEVAKIQSIRFDYKNPKDSYTTMQKEVGKWVLESNAKEEEIPKNTADIVLENTFSIIAKSIVENATDFKESKTKITYTTMDGQTLVLTFGQELENGDIYVKNHEGNIFIMDKTIKDGVLLKKAELLKK